MVGGHSRFHRCLAPKCASVRSLVLICAVAGPPVSLLLTETRPRGCAHAFDPSRSHSGRFARQTVAKRRPGSFFCSPRTGQRSVLLFDSWGGHCPANLEPEIQDEKEVILRTIPKKTAGLIQPLDVYGFRIWKNSIRTFSDRIILLDLPVNLHLRNNIIKLQSLTRNQLSSPRFHNLFKYAWYKSGYLPHRPEPFENPVSCCYPNTDFTPRCAVHGKPALLRCAWCKKYICFEHFFEQYHFCSEYEP